jgi:hypothetical protein
MKMRVDIYQKVFGVRGTTLYPSAYISLNLLQMDGSFIAIYTRRNRPGEVTSLALVVQLFST